MRQKSTSALHRFAISFLRLERVLSNSVRVTIHGLNIVYENFI